MKIRNPVIAPNRDAFRIKKRFASLSIPIITAKTEVNTMNPPARPSIPSIRLTALSMPTNQIRKTAMSPIVEKFITLLKNEIDSTVSIKRAISIKETIN